MVGEWVDGSVSKISELNIISGYPNGAFAPKGELTRAESAVMIYRMLDVLKQL